MRVVSRAEMMADEKDSRLVVNWVVLMDGKLDAEMVEMSVAL